MIGFIQADVLEYYDKTVNSPSGSFYIPAVLRVCSQLYFMFINISSTSLPF